MKGLDLLADFIREYHAATSALAAALDRWSPADTNSAYRLLQVLTDVRAMLLRWGSMAVGTAQIVPERIRSARLGERVREFYKRLSGDDQLAMALGSAAREVLAELKASAAVESIPWKPKRTV